MSKRSNPNSSRQRPAKRARLQRQDATVSIVRKELRKKTDWRYTDVSGSAIPMYNTGAPLVTAFTNLTRGDAGLNMFQGNDMRPQAITLKYWAETSNEYNVFRIMVFQWFDATAPTLTGLLQTGTTGIALCSPINITNRKYIKVLYDRTHSLYRPSTGAYATSDPVTVYIPGKRLRPVHFNWGNNTVQNGNIYLFMLSDDSALQTVNLTYHMRTTFADS